MKKNLIKKEFVKKIVKKDRKGLIQKFKKLFD